jgi:hypothetical protein
MSPYLQSTPISFSSYSSFYSPTQLVNARGFEGGFGVVWLEVVVVEMTLFRNLESAIGVKLSANFLTSKLTNTKMVSASEKASACCGTKTVENVGHAIFCDEFELQRQQRRKILHPHSLEVVRYPEWVIWYCVVVLQLPLIYLEFICWL